MFDFRQLFKLMLIHYSFTVSQNSSPLYFQYSLYHTYKFAAYGFNESTNADLFLPNLFNNSCNEFTVSFMESTYNKNVYQLMVTDSADISMYNLVIWIGLKYKTATFFLANESFLCMTDNCSIIYIKTMIKFKLLYFFEFNICCISENGTYNSIVVVLVRESYFTTFYQSLSVVKEYTQLFHPCMEFTYFKFTIRKDDCEKFVDNKSISMSCKITPEVRPQWDNNNYIVRTVDTNKMFHITITGFFVLFVIFILSGYKFLYLD